MSLFALAIRVGAEHKKVEFATTPLHFTRVWYPRFMNDSTRIGRSNLVVTADVNQTRRYTQCKHGGADDDNDEQYSAVL